MGGVQQVLVVSGRSNPGGIYLRSVELYNSSTERWTSLADTPFGTGWLVLSQYGGDPQKALAATSENNGHSCPAFPNDPCGSTFSFDLATRRWLYQGGVYGVNATSVPVTPGSAAPFVNAFSVGVMMFGLGRTGPGVWTGRSWGSPGWAQSSSAAFSRSGGVLVGLLDGR
jgi:hypothetical protein